MYLLAFNALTFSPLQTVAEETKSDRKLRSEAIKKKENFKIENTKSACNKDTTRYSYNEHFQQD